MDQIPKFVQPIKQFYKDSIMLLRTCRKPDTREVKKVAKGTFLGLCVLGCASFMVKLAAVPMNYFLLKR